MNKLDGKQQVIVMRPSAPNPINELLRRVISGEMTWYDYDALLTLKRMKMTNKERYEYMGGKGAIK